jgi:hypothetical protein
MVGVLHPAKNGGWLLRLNFAPIGHKTPVKTIKMLALA